MLQLWVLQAVEIIEHNLAEGELGSQHPQEKRKEREKCTGGRKQVWEKGEEDAGWLIIREETPSQRRARSLEAELVGFYINYSCCVFKVILCGPWTSESKSIAVSFVTSISDSRQDQQEGVYFSYLVSKTFKGCLLCLSKIIPRNLTRFVERLHKYLHL